MEFDEIVKNYCGKYTEKNKPNRSDELNAIALFEDLSKCLINDESTVKVVGTDTLGLEDEKNRVIHIHEILEEKLGPGFEPYIKDIINYHQAKNKLDEDVDARTPGAM